MKQTQMPYYTTVEGKPTELCVFAARDEPCKRKDCPYGHNPKPRRICRAFHTKGEYCADGENCLLGHHEARAAHDEQKRFKKVIYLNQLEVHNGNNFDEGAEPNGGGATGVRHGGLQHVGEKIEGNGGGSSISVAPIQTPLQNLTNPPQNPNTPLLNPNPQSFYPPLILAQAAQAPAQIPTAPAHVNPTQQAIGTPDQFVPPVNFQALASQNIVAGQQDEIARLKQRQEKIAKEYEALKPLTSSKEDDMRKLQTSLWEMRNENERLKDENDQLESKSSVRPNGLLHKYYEDLPANYFVANSLLDLNRPPPSDKPLEGALTILTTMYAKPVEFAGQKQIIDLAHRRPTTKFSSECSPLPLLGLDKSNIEHAFFSECYLKFPADPSFCPNGVMPNNSSVISLPPGGAFPPRASILKKTPRQFRKLFLSQKESDQVSLIENRHLNLKEGGGLTGNDTLPKEVHLLLADFMRSSVFKNPAVPLISQFLTYLQQGLSSLDDILLKYISLVYNSCPLKVRSYKNGKREVLKNTCHPAYDKWDSLPKRIHSDPAYSTTRLTFAWKGFYMPKGKVCSTRDKYAFFAFAYSMDLFLGALPLWPLDTSAQFQLDRKDPMRHYTIDNVRWLSKCDNVANKPSTGRSAGSLFKPTKNVVRLLPSCKRANILTMEMLGALSKGYGSS